MTHPDYNSPVALKEFMDSKGMSMQKKFGQNFMVNPKARTTIVDELDPKKDDIVWEIGPGLGCMTNEILERGADLTCFEIDRGFIACIKEFFQDYQQNNHFRIIEGDVLKTWKKSYDEYKELREGQPLNIKLSGNLPYNIAATFIADTIVKGLTFDRCVFTVQKEVVDRMCAKPGSKDYSSYSVLCQWAYDVKPGIVLAAGNFWPRPNVASQSVIMTRKENPYQCSNPSLFVKLVHNLFLSRRKTIANNIKPMLNAGVTVESIFAETSIDKTERAENLTIKDFIELTEILESKNAGN